MRQKQSVANFQYKSLVAIIITLISGIDWIILHFSILFLLTAIAFLGFCNKKVSCDIYSIIAISRSRAPRDVLDLNCYKCISKGKRQSNTFLVNRRNSSKKEPLPKVVKAYFYIYFPFPSLHRDRALTERVNDFFFFQSLYQLFINSISTLNYSICFKVIFM